MQTLAPTKSRILGLDIVRAAAILFVLISHFLNIWHLGVIGVEMFFVLSGFLTGRILCKDVERTNFAWLDIMRFWRRRWYRTLPNHFVCLGVLIIAGRAMDIRLGAPLWPYLLFVQNLSRNGDAAFFPTSWSLCVEEWAYLILPITVSCALLITSNRRSTGILIGAVTIVAVPTLLRLGLAPTGNWDSVVRKTMLFRLDAIGYGVLLAYATMYRKDIADRLKSPTFATLGALGIVALYINLGHQVQGPHGPALWKNSLWLSASSICLMPVIAYAGTVGSSKISLIRILAPIVSTYSYSIYLWHLLVVVAVGKYWYLYHGPLSKLSELLVFTAGTITLSWIAYHFIEKPFMDLRDRTDSSRTLKSARWGVVKPLVRS